jgi:hypothetical protein
MHGKAPQRRAMKHASTVDVPGSDRASAHDPPILVITPEMEKLVGESRWNRNHKRVGKLYRELKYPGDSEMQELARLAKVDYSPGDFDCHIRSIILDAHLLNPAYRGLSAPEVKNKLESVRDKAAALKEALKNIDVGRGSSAERAGQILEFALSTSKFREGAVLIPEYVALLTGLSKAASQAMQLVKSKRGPKGATGTSFAFDLFIQHLEMVAWQRRLAAGQRKRATPDGHVNFIIEGRHPTDAGQQSGYWTNYLYQASDRESSTTKSWSGSLLEALKILGPYLPPGLLPAESLGRAVKHARENLTLTSETVMPAGVDCASQYNASGCRQQGFTIKHTFLTQMRVLKPGRHAARSFTYFPRIVNWRELSDAALT